MELVPLSVISNYSLLDSPLTIEQLVTTAKQRGYHAIALTDINVMYGAVEFYNLAKQNDLQPIIGLTLELNPFDDVKKTYPLILLAQDQQGYQNLMKISSLKMVDHHQEPFTLNKIDKYLNHLFIINGLNSQIMQYLQLGDVITAQKLLHEQLQIINSKILCLAINNQQSEAIQTTIKNFARQNCLRLVAINPIRYADSSDQFEIDVLHAIKNNKQISNVGLASNQVGSDYIRDAQELVDHYQHLGLSQAVENTEWIQKQIHLELTFQTPQLPHFPNQLNLNSQDYLAQLCYEGLEKRLKKSTDSNAITQYKKRLDYELKVIHELGFDDYFLIVWDVINYAHQQDIMTGPGRGSAAGSLVAYVLYITQVDPIKYNLLFERFLNPQRAQMPDIDLDIPDDRRDEIIQYVQQKYGKQKVGQIITFGTFGAKQVIRDIGRVFGLSTYQLSEWSHAIPNSLKITLKKSYEESARLRELVTSSDLNRLIFNTALKLEGIPRHTSTHAAGIVLSEHNLTNFVPVQLGTDNLLVTQFTKNEVEKVGLLKIDFLGLRNLTILSDTVHLVRQSDPTFNINQISLNDEQTLSLFQRADTNGVFQFESNGIKNVLRQLKPENFELIIAVDALYRPGPMENISHFVARKLGKEPVFYPDDSLKSILEPTYGIIIYQEQVMQVAAKMGGLSLGEADVLRRAMSKKNRTKIDAMRDKFVNGALENGYTKEVANRVYDYIERFASYGFNRSHAAAYSKMAYELAYLKTHYPAEFFVALLNSVLGNTPKIKIYISEAKQHGVVVCSPNINVSQGNFSLIDKKILFGLLEVKGMRRDFVHNIEQERQLHGSFTDLDNFVQRIDERFCKEDILQNLIYVDAFRDFKLNQAELIDSLPRVLDESRLEIDLLSLDDKLKTKVKHLPDLSIKEKLAHELDLLGTYVSSHPVDQYQQLHQYLNLTLVGDLSINQQVNCLLYITRIKEIRTKRGPKMAFVIANDSSGEISLAIFPNLYQKVQNNLESGQIVVVNGEVQFSRQKEIVVNKINLAQTILKQVKSTTKKDLKNDDKSSASNLGVWHLRLTKDNFNKNNTLEKLKQVLLNNHGNHPVVIHNQLTNKTNQLDSSYFLTANKRTLVQLQNLLGNNNVVYKK